MPSAYVTADAPTAGLVLCSITRMWHHCFSIYLNGAHLWTTIAIQNGGIHCLRTHHLCRHQLLILIKQSKLNESFFSMEVKCAIRKHHLHHQYIHAYYSVHSQLFPIIEEAKMKKI